MEDCALYCESRLKLYELTGRESFKEELFRGISAVLEHFTEGPVLLTRSPGGDREIPNRPSPLYDSSFKSPAATFIAVLKRARILSSDRSLGAALDETAKRALGEALRNPLGSGAALGASTYPDAAYRRITLPRAWAKTPPFAPLPSRFVLDYTDEEGERWQICSFDSCEHRGDGAEALAKLLQEIAHG